MTWTIVFHPDFEAEFDVLDADVADEIGGLIELLEIEGPQLGRPHCDTLNGSAHANMKELRCRAGGGVWRIAFAFDPKREAVVLVAGDKGGANQKRFYKRLIATADERYSEHLDAMKDGKDGTQG